MQVLEETGCDVSTFLNLDDYIEVSIGQQRVRLYIITGVKRDTVFAPQTKKEISVCIVLNLVRIAFIGSDAPLLCKAYCCSPWPIVLHCTFSVSVVFFSLLKRYEMIHWAIFLCKFVRKSHGTELMNSYQLVMTQYLGQWMEWSCTWLLHFWCKYLVIHVLLYLLGEDAVMGALPLL